MSNVKVGDVVVFTGDNPELFGTIGIVESNIDGFFGEIFECAWSVKYDDNINGAWPESVFEVIDHIEPNDFIEMVQKFADTLYVIPPWTVGSRVIYVGDAFEEIEECIGTVIEFDLDLTEDLVQFSNGKRYSIPRKDLEMSKQDDLYKYPIDEVITWRNTASKRVTKIDSDLVYLRKSIEDMNTKYDRLNKKRKKDIMWISKLNNVLYKRVIRDR